MDYQSTERTNETTVNNSSVPFSSYPEILNVKEFAAMLRISCSLAYKLLQRGIIKSSRVGREYIVTKYSVIRFLEGSS